MKKSKRANRPPMEDDEDFDSMPTKKGIFRVLRCELALWVINREKQ